MNQMKVNGEDLVFGLDIGTRSIVGTVGYKQGERFVVAAQEIRQHQTRAMLDGQIHDINRVAATIADIRESLQDKLGLKLEEVCIAAAGRVLKTMNIHVDMDLDKERNVTKEDISTLISMGIEQAFTDFQEKNTTEMHFYCVGYSIVKYYLNGLWMSQPEHHKAKSIGADMIATFLPDDVVDGLYSAVELAELKVANLTLEPIAAIRVAIPEKFRLLNIAMIDVGAGTSDISITNDGSVIAFGMLPFAGDSLTELLAKTCLIDFTTAEQIKTAALEQETIIYEDIMGMEQTISAEEVIAICQPEIDKMSKLTADAVRELNGGTSPSAVFIVGGGGKIKGFASQIASELGLDPKRVAVRGEEIMRDVDFPEGALKDSTIITPIGICLTYYEQYNNFIYITFNGDRIKLYDNNKLTVMDAAMQAAFTHDGLFPRRGQELHYTVNGKNRVTKGDFGESAHVFVNGEEVNLNCSIQSNDVIVLEEATLGEPAQQRISDLIDYNGKITLIVNGDEMQLPKPTKVNGSVVTGEYLIQDGDAIELSTNYTCNEFLEYMGLSPEDALLFINGEKIDSNIEIHSMDKIEIKNKREFELKEIYKEAQRVAKKEAFRAVVKEHVSKVDEKKTDAENESVEPEKAAEESNAEPEQKKEGENAAAEKAKESKPEEPIADLIIEADEKQEETLEKPNESTPEATEVVETEPVKAEQEDRPNESTSKPSEKEALSEQDKISKPDNEPKIKSAEIKNESKQEAEIKEDKKTSEVKSEPEPIHVLKNKKEKQEQKEAVKEVGKKIIVIVNQKPVVMRGKKKYSFVDIFDYIDFDTTKLQGKGIATLVNGKDAQYTQELYNGDKIEVYWKV